MLAILNKRATFSSEIYFIFSMLNQEVKLFVYGSLRRGFHHPAHRFINHHFSFISGAKVKGLLYDLGEYPGALPTLENHFITGELFKLKELCDFKMAIAQLDEYEGLNVCKSEPLFIRAITPVYFEDQVTTAWIYWYNNPIRQDQLIPSGNILNHIKY